MDFWIVAIDHGLQLAKDVNDSDKIRAQKDQLEALLRAAIPKRKVRFIAEESKIGETTFASALAIASQRLESAKYIIVRWRERDDAGEEELTC
ncbi:MAG: hypothetical protein WBQ03_10395 [Candidatus Sulfotelmatobacter sp.]